MNRRTRSALHVVCRPSTRSRRSSLSGLLVEYTLYSEVANPPTRLEGRFAAIPWQIRRPRPRGRIDSLTYQPKDHARQNQAHSREREIPGPTRSRRSADTLRSRACRSSARPFALCDGNDKPVCPLASLASSSLHEISQIPVREPPEMEPASLIGSA